MITPSDKFYQDVDGQWWYGPDRNDKRRRVTPYSGKCHYCGAEFLGYPDRKRLKLHCSADCYFKCRQATARHGQVRPDAKGPDSTRWAGGRVTRRGYVLVFMPEHHSIAGRSTQRKYVLEHRVVMESKLGRAMLPNETVHHINGIRHDNRPENLELWGYQPPGQRVGEGRHCETCTCETHVR